MDPRAVVQVLADIAATAAETLQLQQVFDRVAASLRTLVPFDHMAVVRVVDGQRAVIHASTVPCPGDPECHEPAPLTAWSPRIRPRPGPIPRVDDVAGELDPAFPVDAEILKRGLGSSLWEPFATGGAFRGGIWLSAERTHAFTDEHQEVLRPLAAVLDSAVEHWRMWDAERTRRERLDRLESHLGTLAESLDVRDVFKRISDAVRNVLPHHLMVLTELGERGRTFRVVAVAGESESEAPAGPVELTAGESEGRLLDHEILADLQAELGGDTERSRVLRATGMRSWLRVPVRLWGEVRGSLGFLHRDPAVYQAADVEVARRLADRIALALSHQRLAEESRVAAEARERAARLEERVESLARELEARDERPVIGVSRSWKDVLRHVGRVAPSETTVLVTGESGTGKELIARLVHHGSARARGPFVAINCAALPEQLLESELFGHEKGAFTGAVAAQPGRIEQAAGGTLFLDEVGEMSPLVQAKLLRVLQEREFQRLGSSRTLRADVRLLAATNRDLTEMVARGGFREDLYYRLAVFVIRVPALRERPEDILPLADAFREELGRSMGRPSDGFSKDAREWLLAYPWPGNVRELRNAIERAILLCDRGLITREHLPVVPPRAAPAASGPGSGGAAALDPDAPLPAGGVDLEAIEKSLVARALAQTAGNKSRAARLLGLTRAQLYSRIEKYRLN